MQNKFRDKNNPPRSIITREYDGAAVAAMAVAPPAYKPQSAKQRGVQPDKTSPAQNQWFTKKDVAARLVQTTRREIRAVGKNWDDYVVVEPSAGDGRFYNLLPPARRIGIDLAPQIDTIIKQDFLTWQPPRPGKYIVIGNPPFGVRGDLADAFIKRSAMFADVCAFILPIGYMDAQRSYFAGYELIYREALPGDIFVNVRGHESKQAGQGAINTCFNIWAASNAVRPPIYDYLCDADVRVNACNFPADATDFRGAHNWFVKARYYGATKVSNAFDDVTSRNSYYVVGVSFARLPAAKQNLIKQINWQAYATRAMNGSYSITLKNARRAMYDIGLARKVIKRRFDNGDLIK